MAKVILLIYTLLSIYAYNFVMQVPRNNFLPFIVAMSLLFALYALLFFHIKKHFSQSFIAIIAIGIVFRLSTLPYLPQLSDDFYRFVWDGMLSSNGENPFLYLPKDIIQDTHFQAFFPLGLFEKLNSPNYYTVYPPVCQAIFAFSASVFPKDIFSQVVAMKFCVFLAEMGSLFLLYQLLKKFNLPIYLLALYAFNPLAIVELTGNLHFEAFMIVGILGAAYFLSQKLSISAFFFAIAVCAKLLPLMFLPFLYRKLGFKSFLIYTSWVAFFSFLMFLPFLNVQIFTHIAQSAGLYFQSFEFNASLYYLLREIGYLIFGYNMIHILGKILPILVLVGIYFIEKQVVLTAFDFAQAPPINDRSFIWLKQIFYALSLYLFCATTVNPWYVVPLLAFTPFVQTRYTILWSFLLPFSYFTYINGGCKENLWLVLVEYAIVICYVLAVLIRKKKSSC